MSGEFICLNQPGQDAVCFCGHVGAEHHLGECDWCGCDQFLDEQTLW